MKNKITVHVYGSRYEADRKAAAVAYQNLFCGKKIVFPRKGEYTHSFGISITGDNDDIRQLVWQFTCIAESLSCYSGINYQFEVHHFEGFSVEEIAPMFYDALRLPCINLPKEYRAYIDSISTACGLPTLSDINVYDSLDERSAVEHFLGKTKKDIYRQLAEDIDCSCSFMESFYYLGPKAFAYYVEAWEQFYQDFKKGVFEHKEYDESMVAEATLFFLSQRTLMDAEKETPQGRESILNLLNLCEQHYRSETGLYEKKTLKKPYANAATSEQSNTKPRRRGDTTYIPALSLCRKFAIVQIE